MTDDLTQWSYGTKLNNCSDDKQHNEDCDGNCGQHPATKGQVDLHNETSIWASKQMPIVSAPTVLAGHLPVRVPFYVEALSIDKRLESMIEFFVEKNLIDEAEFIEFHRLRFAEFLKETRNEIEKAQAKASIVIPHIGLGKLPGD